tara:strand:- start:600 stop:773 length:174 start_codon:yes stop_codon:yes gene_type:complete
LADLSAALKMGKKTGLCDLRALGGFSYKQFVRNWIEVPPDGYRDGNEEAESCFFIKL